MPGESIPFPTSPTASLPESAPAMSEPDTRIADGPGGAVHDAALGAHAARTGAAHADDVIERITQSAHHTIDRLAESAGPSLSRLEAGLSSDALQARADHVREIGDEWTESLRATVRDNPLASIGVALAVGLLIARLSR